MKNYTDEKNAQIIISLLKEHGIKKIIASPGTSNMAIIASMQQDDFFEIYSSVDERSAAYLACGLAFESSEPVVLSCTSATASRNYLPGLTEAYYRKLPVLALTSMQSIASIGNLTPQVIDRSILPIDTVKFSVALPIVENNTDLWDCELKVNKAILELTRNGGGPVHINVPTMYSRNYDIKELPTFRVIKRITQNSIFPLMPKGKIGIIIGSHDKMSDELTSSINSFCETNNAVVFCDHTSGYIGKYRVLFALAASQNMIALSDFQCDLIIHIGEISGDYYSRGIALKAQVWRVNEDGEIRDTFKGLQNVFEMPEEIFFKYYTNSSKEISNQYLQKCKAKLKELQEKVPTTLPFSNIWVASQMAHLIPINSTIQFAILNSLRAWNFFELPETVTSFSNVGGFGIDGNLSSLIGASLFNKNKLYFNIIGDLSFFYDMNVLGNRHVSNNLRILVINNGTGIEFRQSTHIASQFGAESDEYIAAGGHFGHKSHNLIKHYSTDLGFEYICANNKEEFLMVYHKFINENITDKPIIFEVFTNAIDESNALEMIMNLEVDIKVQAKNLAKQILGQTGINVVKKIMNK